MLQWNVYRGDFNSGKIEVFNIFNHYGFYADCVRAKKKYKDDKEGFAEEVRHSLMYFFWSKCEYEVIIDHWPDGEMSDCRRRMTIGEYDRMLRDAGKKEINMERGLRKPEYEIELRMYPTASKYREIKVDVCDQVKNNWDVFIDYLWENRSELKKKK